MISFDRQSILERKGQLENARRDVLDEVQRYNGAIQLCDALIAEIDASENNQPIEAGNAPANEE
jgi:hypothetical protein